MKTANELGLYESELRNLLKVRDLLASKDIVKDSPSEPKDRFNMSTACMANVNHCGYVMCIGGWMKLFELNLQPDDNGLYPIDEDVSDTLQHYVVASKERPIGALFWPKTRHGYTSDNLAFITVDEALVAIDSFIETGKPIWPEYVLEG